MAGAVIAASAMQIVSEYDSARLLTRNFYSSLRIVEVGSGPETRRIMEHAGVEHGSQFLDPARRAEALSYYGESSGVVMAMQRQRELTAQSGLSAGFIGLGAGALAAYGQKGDLFRFYEINPQVVDLARAEFTYLSDSAAQISLAIGDARLVLDQEAPQGFDILVVDAFSGGAIPLHLLTREAMAIYRKHVRPGGSIIFHISNRFVDLQPALARLAVEEGMVARLVRDVPEGVEDEDSPLLESDWVIFAQDEAWFASASMEEESQALRAAHRGPAWTDDFHNILSAIRFSGSE